MENQFAEEAEIDGSGMEYEIDIPYFENRTGKNIFSYDSNLCHINYIS